MLGINSQLNKDLIYRLLIFQQSFLARENEGLWLEKRAPNILFLTYSSYSYRFND